jgi:simple sugar transport system ATP-binding protein
MELLSARGITKYFGETRVLANDGISLSLMEGETRAVVGENGAGKSTLARILAGLLAPDSGTLTIHGRSVRLGSVKAAETAGIGFVPQVSLLAEGLTVAENLVLAREPRAAGFLVSKKKAYVETALLIERFGFRLDPEAIVSSLGASERRQAEIARALARGGEVLVLDEPTSILSEAESAGFLALLRTLSQWGTGIILITHRLSEVLDAADSITVLREGRVEAELAAKDADEAMMSRLMARSRSASAAEADRPRPAGMAEDSEGECVLELRGVQLQAGSKRLDITLKSGEVLAAVALAGNGLGRLEDLVSGMKESQSGKVLIQGKNLRGMPRELLRSTLMAYVPSDREGRGLCLSSSLRENVLALRRGDFGARDWIGRSRRDKAAREAGESFGLKADPRSAAASLSGGNRQRLILARELDRPRPLLILAEPMQSLDLASQAELFRRIRELCARGSAALLIVSSIEEALGIADRVIVLYRGEAVFEARNEGPSMAPAILAAMTGSAAIEGERLGA